MDVEQYLIENREDIQQKVDFSNLEESNAIVTITCAECDDEIGECGACGGLFQDEDLIYCDKTNKRHIHDNCFEVIDSYEEETRKR